MRETIGTIDSSVERFEKMSQGDESALSRTERALYARETPKGEERAAESAAADESECPMDPDKKLACMLAGVL